PSSRLRPPPTSTLFPYTTLFRSRELLRHFFGVQNSRRLGFGLHLRDIRRHRPIMTVGIAENCGQKNQPAQVPDRKLGQQRAETEDRKSTRLNSSHLVISYAVFCL